MNELSHNLLTTRVRAVLDAPSDRLDDLVRAAGIDPQSDLRFGDWHGLDLTNADLRGFNFTGADLTGATFKGARVAGAIFDLAKYDLASLYKPRDVICFTATGRIVALESEATAADFARSLSSSIPRRALRVRINGKTASPTTKLKNGDQVEATAKSPTPGRKQKGAASSRRSLQRFRVGRSRAGLGLFAIEPIKKGAFIVEYTGSLLTNKECDERRDNRYWFEVNARWTIDGSPRSNVARYVNHSCRPNADPVIRGRRIRIKAIKNIQPGDEITYDYGKDHFNTFIKPHGCKCSKCIEKRREERRRLRAVNKRKRQRIERKRALVQANQARSARSLIDSKRSTIMQILSQRERVDFENVTDALYRSVQGDLFAVCTLSRRYKRGRAHYWYGYSRHWREFLSQGSNSLLVLGCTDRDVAYAIPNTEITKVMDHLYRTPDRHWHLVVEEDEANNVNLVTRSGAKISLDKFRLTSKT